MINSGLSLLRTLNILAEQTANPLLAKTISRCAEDGSEVQPVGRDEQNRGVHAAVVSMVKDGGTALSSIRSLASRTRSGRLQAPPEGQVPMTYR